MMVNGILFLRTGENKGTFHVIQKGMAAANHHSYHSLLSNKAHTCSNHLLYFSNTKKHRHTITTPTFPPTSPNWLKPPRTWSTWNQRTGPVLSTTATPGDSPNAPSQQTLTSQHLGWKRKNLKRSKNHSATSDLKKINFQFMNQILKQTFWGVTID